MAAIQEAAEEGPQDATSWLQWLDDVSTPLSIFQGFSFPVILLFVYLLSFSHFHFIILLLPKPQFSTTYTKTRSKRKALTTPSSYSDSTKDHKMYVVWDFFNPSYTCPWDMERIGQLGDGGKWVCGLSKYIEFSEMAESGEGASATSSSSSTKGLSKKTEEDGEDGDGAEEDDGKHGDKLVVYSFGVRDDSSFEEVMLSETNAEVVAVDFSVGSVCPFLLPVAPSPFPPAPHSNK